jgi:hypothetical protein
MANFRNYKYALLAALTTAACNNDTKSGLRVAGGRENIDGGDAAAAKYPGTVYVEMKGEDTNGVIRTVRNVGTIFKTNNSSKYGIILSLADAMLEYNGMQVLPIFKAVQLKVYLSDTKGTAANLPPMQLDTKTGQFKTNDGKFFPVLSVGLATQRVANSKIKDSDVAPVAQNLLLDDSLPVSDGVNSLNLRVQHTSYMLIGVDSSNFANIADKIPSLIPASSSRPKDNLVMVGFGDVKHKAETESAKSLALSDALPEVTKRNYVSVTPLSVESPISKLTASSQNANSQVWEIQGSGLCGSSDGSNYDTGASIYSGPNVVGIAVRSSSISSKFLGRLDCSAKELSDMVSLVISPSETAIKKFMDLANQK